MNNKISELGSNALGSAWVIKLVYLGVDERKSSVRQSRKSIVQKLMII